MAETSPGGATPKLCGTCGLDCSGKPRVKDPKGNYMCMECVDRAKAARDVQTGKTKPAPSAAADLGTVNLADNADNAFLLAIDDKPPDKSDENKKPCPSCFKKMPINSVMCVNCGYNSKSGEQLHVRVLKPKEQRDKSSSRGDGHTFFTRIFSYFTPTTLALTILALTAGPIAAGVLGNIPIVFGIGILLLIVIGLLVEIAILVDAFKSGNGTAAIIMIVGWFIPILFLYKIYYMFVKCENDDIKASWIAVTVAGIAAGILMAVSPDFMASLESM